MHLYSVPKCPLTEIPGTGGEGELEGQQMRLVALNVSDSEDLSLCH
jgi:hypothetical protein